MCQTFFEKFLKNKSQTRMPSQDNGRGRLPNRATIDFLRPPAASTFCQPR